MEFLVCTGPIIGFDSRNETQRHYTCDPLQKKFLNINMKHNWLREAFVPIYIDIQHFGIQLYFWPRNGKNVGHESTNMNGQDDSRSRICAGGCIVTFTGLLSYYQVCSHLATNQAVQSKFTFQSSRCHFLANWAGSSKNWHLLITQISSYFPLLSLFKVQSVYFNFQCTVH